MTPEEFEALMAQLEPVPADRRAGIARMVFKQVATCPRCRQPVRRCDPRLRIVEDDESRLAHPDCAGDAPRLPPEGPEGEEVTDG